MNEKRCRPGGAVIVGHSANSYYMVVAGGATFDSYEVYSFKNVVNSSTCTKNQ